MAHDLREGVAAVNAAADATCALLNSGYLRLYSGVRPEFGDDPITTQTLLCELRWASPAFAAASNGAAPANTIAPALILASGVATWFRALRIDGSTVVFDGEVGVADCNLNIIDTNLVADGSSVEVTGYTHTQPKP